MSDNPATRKAAFWIAAVFVLGVALGGVFGFMYAHSSTSANNSLTQQQRRAHRVEQLSKDLSLTSDQRQQLDTILSQMHNDYKTIHTQSDAQIDQVRQKGRVQIREMLTSDQRPKFEDFLKRMDEERKKNTPPDR